MKNESAIKKTIDRLEELIERWKTIQENVRAIEMKTDIEREQLRSKWERCLQSTKNILRYSQLEEFLERIDEIMKNKSYDSFKAAWVIGVLQSAQDELSRGFFGKIKYLLHADFFDSVVDQAKELLRTGHRIPSAVLSRVIIEQWLRDIAEKESISAFDTEKLSNLNNSLKKSGTFSTPKWRQVQSFLDVGNSAAHGKDDEFEDDDIQRMIDFIKTNCM
jgi:hypothetical protein